jgi:single-strand DNA-binding protein
MNDTRITIVGNVVDEPRLRETKTGVKVLSFRIASTSRRYDREQDRWMDNESLFATVTCWRWTAENVAASLHKGQPVIATGRLYSREYTIDEHVRVSYELDADSVGHDLARGRTQFTRTRRPAVITRVDVDESGLPADLTDHRLDIVAPEFGGRGPADADLPQPEFATAG